MLSLSIPSGIYLKLRSHKAWMENADQQTVYRMAASWFLFTLSLAMLVVCTLVSVYPHLG